MAKRQTIPALLAELKSQEPHERNPAKVRSLFKRLNNKLNYALQAEQDARQMLEEAKELISV
jgi:hypothetical protein